MEGFARHRQCDARVLRVTGWTPFQPTARCKLAVAIALIRNLGFAFPKMHWNAMNQEELKRATLHPQMPQPNLQFGRLKDSNASVEKVDL